MQITGQNRSLWTIIFLLAAGVRAGILIVDLNYTHHLYEDRDAYLDIAHQLASGKGYSLSETGTPTAFRPPLYPLVLAGLELTGTGVYSVAVFHFILGLLTIYLTYRVARKFLPEKYALGAMAFIAVDPLLIQYSTFVMTETLFVFLFTWLIYEIVKESSSERIDQSRNSLKKFGLGLLFGLCALCRPTVWAFGILWLIYHIIFCIRKKKKQQPVSFVSPILILGIIMIVSPWLYRNWKQFDKPVFTTTHGGYTLLLGNNSVFYEEVVNQKWGTVWSFESLKDWQTSLEQEMKSSPEPVITETERDKWMYQKAFQEIKKQPGNYFSACWLRFRRFWNLTPTGNATSGIPSWLRLGVGAYYLIALLGMLAGIIRLKKEEWPRWFPLILACIAFTGVHLFYWTNMRMRAPLLPLICILMMRSFLPRSEKSEE